MRHGAELKSQMAAGKRKIAREESLTAKSAGYAKTLIREFLELTQIFYRDIGRDVCWWGERSREPDTKTATLNSRKKA
jgi:hypothetical protein